MTGAPARTLLLGADGGIGRAVRDRLEAHGSYVSGAGQDDVDLAQPGVAAPFVRAAWADAGGFDALVHCAGLYPAHHALDTSEDVFDRLLAVNARSALMAGAEFARLCAADGRSGSMVFVSSGAARRARPGTTAYAASKAALEAVVRGLALETAPLGVRCNAVAPGFVDVRSTLSPVPREYVEAVSAASPQGRVARAGDIVPAITWLLSEDAAWITGQSIPVDGGDSIGSATAANWLTSDTS
ncbi:SDR family NAD(P)-dependent oxidoreductase [Streptomyces sulphureus]|uniref:SDR family NAD(P)-dependent oxidoreductase n=1 Tax=Streptomyces sulphureus TaxID=47758 RepID=UPI000370DC38|nr:SDR family oxidoreductase [Streptomyces sulphureus]